MLEVSMQAIVKLIIVEHSNKDGKTEKEKYIYLRDLVVSYRQYSKKIRRLL